MGYSNIAAGRGRYMGTMRTTAAAGTPARGGVTEDSFGGAATQVGGKRFLWNRYNRVLRAMAIKDTTDSHTYTTATWRQYNAALGNKIEYVIGLSLEMVSAHAHAIAESDNTGAAQGSGVGVDSTTINSAQLDGTIGRTLAGGLSGSTPGYYKGYPGVGYHALVWLQIAGASGTVTWYGDNAVTYVQSGMFAEVWG